MYGAIERFSVREKIYPSYIHGINSTDNSVPQSRQSDYIPTNPSENIVYKVAKILKKCSNNVGINHFYDQNPIEENMVFSPSGLLPYLMVFAKDFSKNRIGMDVIDAHFSYDEDSLGKIKVKMNVEGDGNRKPIPVSISTMFLLDAMLSRAENNGLEWRNIVLDAISILSMERGMEMVEYLDQKIKYLIISVPQNANKVAV